MGGNYDDFNITKEDFMTYSVDMLPQRHSNGCNYVRTSRHDRTGPGWLPDRRRRHGPVGSGPIPRRNGYARCIPATGNSQAVDTRPWSRQCPSRCCYKPYPRSLDSTLPLFLRTGCLHLPDGLEIHLFRGIQQLTCLVNVTCNRSVSQIALIKPSII